MFIDRKKSEVLYPITGDNDELTAIEITNIFTDCKGFFCVAVSRLKRGSALFTICVCKCFNLDKKMY